MKELQAGERKLAEMDFEGALSKFKKAAKLDPASADAYFGIAEAALGVPKVPAEEVIAAYRRAIELVPGNPFYHARLGAFCLEAGQWELAEQSYNKAAEADPENGYLYLSEFGLEYYRSMLEKLDPDTPPKVREEAGRKALKYVLKAMKMSEPDALRLLKGP